MATRKRHKVGGKKKHARSRWKRDPGIPGIQAPLSFRPDEDYVISHRPGQHAVSYRPKGHHAHVGNYETEAEAKRAADRHALLSKRDRLFGEVKLFGKLAYGPTPPTVLRRRARIERHMKGED